MNDLISRRAAIDAAIEATDSWDGVCNIGRQKRIENYINKLPSAHPKKGKWINNGVNPYPYTDNYKLLYHIYTCDQCGGEWLDTPDFCPMCGADMRG